jgi:hypothetical protein
MAIQICFSKLIRDKTWDGEPVEEKLGDTIDQYGGMDALISKMLNIVRYQTKRRRERHLQSVPEADP